MRTAATLQRALRDPTDALIPINRPVRAVLRDGTVVTGRRLNEDTHTVQLIDERERLVSLEKASLREYSVTTAAQMPSYENVSERCGARGSRRVSAVAEGDRLMLRRIPAAALAALLLRRSRRRRR